MTPLILDCLLSPSQALAEAVQLLAGNEEGFDKLWTAGAAELLRAGCVLLRMRMRRRPVWR